MIQNYNCKHCKSDKLIIKETGPHIGIHCGDCGKWQQWVSKTDIPELKQLNWEIRGSIKEFSKMEYDNVIIY